MKVFVSYSGRDRHDALRVKAELDRLGHDAWMDVFDIRAGAALDAELEKRVLECDALCVLLSPTAVESRYVQDELRHARAAREKGLRLIPLLLRPARIPTGLDDLLYLDATRGVDAPDFLLALSRALVGIADEAQVLDAQTRATLADRALCDEAEAAFVGLREDLAPFLDLPIRELQLEIDGATWPDAEGSILEVFLDVDVFRGRATFALAPYVEGRTWPDGRFEELAPDDLFASETPRVDVRFTYLGHDVSVTKTRSEAGSPLVLSVTLHGEEYASPPRGGPTYVAERFEIPSLATLIATGSSVTLWRTRPGEEPREVHPSTTDLDLRLEACFEADGVNHTHRLWSSRRTRDEQVLVGSPTLLACTSPLERELLLAAHHPRPLPNALTDHARKQRIGTALDAGGTIAPEDGWIAFRMMRSASQLLARRKKGVDRAAQELRAAITHVPSVDGYGELFALWSARMSLATLIARGAGTAEEMDDQLARAVASAEQAAAQCPSEPDYQRAIGRACAHRAALRARLGLPIDPADLTRPLDVLRALIAADPLPWRQHELEQAQAAANEIAREAGERAIPAPAVPIVASAAWLDPARRANEEKTKILSPMLQCSTFLSHRVPYGAARYHLVDDELIQLHADADARGWLSIGLRDARADAPSSLLALAPLTLLARGEWTVIHEASVTELGDTKARLEVRDVTAVRARIRRGDAPPLRLYVLRASARALSWTVTLALPERGSSWESAAADDATAAHTFSRLQIS